MTAASCNTVPTNVAVRPAVMVRLAGKVVSLPGRLLKYWEDRRAVRHLSEMSDWQLADIGLTRSDVDLAAVQPTRRGATRLLHDIAHDRSAADSMSRRIA